MKRDSVWLIELVGELKWLTETKKLTTNAYKAKKFKTRMAAIGYCVENKLGPEYIQTEHQFI